MRPMRRGDAAVLMALASCVAAGGCGNAPTTPSTPKVGVAQVVEHWGRMTQITYCGPSTMTGHLEIHIKTKEIVTKDYDLTYELTVNSVATATGAITPLFVTGKVTRDACN